MIELLIVVLIILVITNIVIGIVKKPAIDIKPQLQEIEGLMKKFDVTLERTERSIKDEFQRNRKETNDISITNREELGKSLSSFSEQFSKNVKDLNDLLKEKFGDFSKKQTEISKQIKLERK